MQVDLDEIRRKFLAIFKLESVVVDTQKKIPTTYVSDHILCWLAQTRHGQEVVVLDKDGTWLWICPDGKPKTVATNSHDVLKSAQQMVDSPNSNMKMFTTTVKFVSDEKLLIPK